MKPSLRGLHRVPPTAKLPRVNDDNSNRKTAPISGGAEIKSPGDRVRQIQEMQELVDWYGWGVAQNFRHPLILIANFVFEYLAIHPFQDGNGRMARLAEKWFLASHLGSTAWHIPSEQFYQEHRADYYNNIKIGS